MATLKIIANKNCKLFIDQDLICEIEAQKLYKHELEVGVYLVDVAPLCEDSLGSSISFDLNVETANQQILKRINFEIDEPSSPTHSASYINNPDVIFYNGVAMVSANGKYGYIDQSQKWIFEPQFDEAEHMKNGYAIVARNFDQGKKYTFVNPKGELCVGMWFDEIVSRKEDFVIIRRYHELFKINTQQMSIIESYFLEGSIIKDSPIPVSKEVNGKKKYIYVDDNLNITLDMEFDYASNFSNSGYAEVEKYGIRRFINKEGDICILNTLEEIEANNKLFMLLPIHNERGGNYEWCGLLETPDNDDLFLKNVYRLAIRKDGKWGYSCVRRDSWGNNKLTTMFEPKFDEFLSDSRNGYVIAKDGIHLCVANLIGAQYARGEKKGQYVYGKVGDVLFKYQCDEMYPINKRDYEWRDYGGYGGFEVKRAFQNVIVKVNGKYGVISRDNKLIQKCIYDNMYSQYWKKQKEKTFEDKPFIIERDGKKGLLSVDGAIILGCEYSEIYRIGLFWCVKRSGAEKYVLYDNQENIFSDFEFDDIVYGDYKEEARYSGYSTSGYDDYIIKNNSKYGVISKNANLIVDCIYDSLKHIHARYEVSLNTKIGIVNNEGKVIVPCDYDKIEEYWGPYGDCDCYFVYKDHTVGLFSIDGDCILDCVYDSITDISYIGYSYCFEIEKNKKFALFYKDNIVTDYIFDSIGQIVESDYSINDGDHYSFHEVIINGKHGIINNEGEFVLNCKYESVEFLNVCSPWMKPYFKVGIGGMIGILTKKEEVVIPAIYEDIIPMSYYCNSVNAYVVVKEGKKAILRNDAWDREQKLITDFEFTCVKTQYSKEHRVLGYSVAKDGKTGFLDGNGNMLIPIMYDSIQAIENPEDHDSILLYIVEQNKKAGAIDINGDVVVQCNYDNCDFIDTDNNLFLCYNDDVIGEDGQRVFGYGTPCTAYDVINKETYHLKSKSVFGTRDELKLLGL